jgi:cell division transport system permease protein
MIRLRAGPTSGALIPRDAAGETWLAGVIAVLCFMACLGAVGAVAADRAAHGWARALRAEATVQVRPRVDETGAAAATRAAETLAGVRGVTEAEALGRPAAEALLRPWVGEAILPDLPLPHLVIVRLDPDEPASAPTLSRALAEAGLDASVDDHSLWRAEVEHAAMVITTLGIAGFLVTALGAAAAIVYATRAGLAARRGVIQILSLSGATDGRIAWLFQRRFAAVAAVAGLIGAGAAAIVLATVRVLGGAGGLSPALPILWSDLLILSPCPLLAATVALVAARATALRSLART